MCIHETSAFLEIIPQLWGSLEILLGLFGIVLTVWRGPFCLFFCFTLLTGAVTISAGCWKKTMHMVRSSQILNFLNAIIVFISFHSEHEYVQLDWTIIAHVVCAILVFIVSAIVGSTVCKKCCFCCRPDNETEKDSQDPQFDEEAV